MTACRHVSCVLMNRYVPHNPHVPPIHPLTHPKYTTHERPQEGHEEGILDRDPAELVPEEPDSLKAGFKPAAPAPAAGAGAGGGAAGGMVKRKEHPKYSKYFKMLKIGQPVEVVRVCKYVPLSRLCARPLHIPITKPCLTTIQKRLHTHTQTGEARPAAGRAGPRHRGARPGGAHPRGGRRRRGCCGGRYVGWVIG